MVNGSKFYINWQRIHDSIQASRATEVRCSRALYFQRYRLRCLTKSSMLCATIHPQSLRNADSEAVPLQSAEDQSCRTGEWPFGSLLLILQFKLKRRETTVSCCCNELARFSPYPGSFGTLSSPKVFRRRFLSSSHAHVVGLHLFQLVRQPLPTASWSVYGSNPECVALGLQALLEELLIDLESRTTHKTFDVSKAFNENMACRAVAPANDQVDNVIEIAERKFPKCLWRSRPLPPGSPWTLWLPFSLCSRRRWPTTAFPGASTRLSRYESLFDSSVSVIVRSLVHVVV